MFSRRARDLERRVAALELQLADQRTALAMALTGLGAAVGMGRAERVEAAAYTLANVVVPGAPAEAGRLAWIQSEAAAILRTTATAIRQDETSGGISAQGRN